MGYAIATIDTVQPLTCVVYDIVKVCKEDVIKIKRAPWVKQYELSLSDIFGVVGMARAVDMARDGDIIHIAIGVSDIGVYSKRRINHYNGHYVRYALHNFPGEMIVERDDYR